MIINYKIIEECIDANKDALNNLELDKLVDWLLDKDKNYEEDMKILISTLEQSGINTLKYLTHAPLLGYAYNDSIKSVFIPGNIKSIDDSAFFYCKNLETVYIEEGVEEIDFDAFADCDRLTQIFLPSTLKWISVYAIPVDHELTISFNGNKERFKTLFNLLEGELSELKNWHVEFLK